MEEWVRHESEGYPPDASLPPYRFIEISYKATFSGPFGSGIRNAPIPTQLIRKFAGERWVKYELRQSIAGIDDLVASDPGGILTVDASDLILRLQGKVYQDYACNDVQATVSRAALVEIQHAVRSRILDFTLQLQKSVPEAAAIDLGTAQTLSTSASDSQKVSQIHQQIVYGNVTSISSSGPGSSVVVHSAKGNTEELVRYLANAGILKADAQEFATTLASENPRQEDEPFGSNAREWLSSNLAKALDGTWKVGVNVATKVLTEGALQYYGLK